MSDHSFQLKKYDGPKGPSVQQLIMDLTAYKEQIEQQPFPSLQMNDQELEVLSLARIMPETWLNHSKPLINAIQELI